MFESQMAGGYPTESVIDDFLAERGIELLTPGNPNFTAEFKQFVWGLLNAVDWATALGVFAETPALFNVRGGKYLFKEATKTYTPGDAMNPTDNDTTYVWMEDDNTVGYGIDGDGWPTTEHIKLAEIDVDADGIITDIRDLRGETGLRYLKNFADGTHLAETGTNGGVPFVLTATLTAGSTVVIHNANAPFKYRVVRAWSVATSADGGTWQVKNGTDNITEAVAVTATDKTIDSAATIDDAYHEVAADGSLSVAGDGSLADIIVYIECVRVS